MNKINKLFKKKNIYKKIVILNITTIRFYKKKKDLKKLNK